ncbi:YchJ family metal-binding protein [Methylomonas sp. OY6]|uniref:YchJ family metal-binding protein n=1 Tax=Methylomonas defluvii TaxID=3045149 RepID=A0ABU4UIP0_9GAMM|nr:MULTISPECIES: YchJ family metal-binding protein [unclassified Methylomonas]MDX8128710.1 YchJ family metal-binding protein [Methylomonas sp. OY6]
MTLCPGGSKLDYAECCGPIIDGAPAPTTEALMRSRYTAFVQRKLDHVERTHAPEIKEDFNRAEAERMAEECEWRSLEIRNATEMANGYMSPAGRHDKTSQPERIGGAGICRQENPVSRGF